MSTVVLTGMFEIEARTMIDTTEATGMCFRIPPGFASTGNYAQKI
jgi:hypothetical protein